MKRINALFCLLVLSLFLLTGCESRKEDMNAGTVNINSAIEEINTEAEKNQPEEKQSEEKQSEEKQTGEKQTEINSPVINDDGSQTKQGEKGHIIVIDPGHQANGDSQKEPDGPGSANMKARVSSGTTGKFSGVPEYKLNLKVSLSLRDELVRRGYTVYMTRETHDVNISNKERAEFATNMGAEITVRIHANGSENSSVSGALTLCPSSSNPYVSNLYKDSLRLSQNVLDCYCASTGLKNQGVMANDSMTGINWCTMPVTILEMGYMTNQYDDTYMNSDANLTAMVNGIADGIDKYFSE